jgi:hypothetical protein
MLAHPKPGRCCLICQGFHNRLSPRLLLVPEYWDPDNQIRKITFRMRKCERPIGAVRREAGDESSRCLAELFSRGSIEILLERLRGEPGELAKATQIVMNHSGDTRHTFDAMDNDAVAKAEKRFKELTGRGFTAATRTTSGEAALTRSFDPTAEETLFIPRLVGG